MALQRLKDAAEKAKCDLSMRDAVEINLPFIASDAEGPRHLNYELTRENLEGLVGDIVEGTLKSVEQCCVDAGVQVGGHRSGRAGRRPDAHAARAEAGHASSSGSGPTRA